MIGNTLAFIFGSIVGSFLNVCIYRLPQSKSVVWPGSHCPKCEKRIPWYDNIPYLGFIMLKGKCRFCKKNISLVYIAVELITALMFVALFNRFGLTYDFCVYTVFACALITATFIDIYHRIIPYEISVGGLIVGVILNIIKGFNLSPFSWNYLPMLNALIGLLSGGLIIWLSGKIFDLVYFKLLKRPPIQGETESMGGGDVLLLAMIGSFLGWQGALLTFFIAPFFGATVGIINLLVKKDHTIPYGPFLAVGALFSLFWAGNIIRIFLP
jgi:leader peptidase (prepilin peptidase)/N-methyltransferase